MFCVVPNSKGSQKTIREYVNQLLCESVLGYDCSLQGIVLAFGRIHLPQDGMILKDYSPFALLTCAVKLLILEMKPGTCLDGIVNFVGYDQIGLQVFDTFPAVIRIEQGLQNYKLIPGERISYGGEQDSVDTDQVVRVGVHLRFLVQQVQVGTSERLFLIEGTLNEDALAGTVTSKEKLGLIKEQQSMETKGYDIHKPQDGNRKRRRQESDASDNDVTNRKQDEFAFGVSYLGDPLRDNSYTAAVATHKRFSDESSSDTESRKNEREETNNNIVSIDRVRLQKRIASQNSLRTIDKQKKKEKRKKKKHQKKKESKKERKRQKKKEKNKLERKKERESHKKKKQKTDHSNALSE
eukprot:jgi/Galph1/5950/GphlegSOOS_G4610.1